MTTAPMSGRRAQAARNDDVILQAAREVFIADPGAPISAVAERAGVGISALYRRYASKEVLLQTLCSDGLDRFISEIEKALADDGDAWESFAACLHRLVDADTNSLTTRLAGTFTPTEELHRRAQLGSELQEALFERTRPLLREDLVVSDLALIQEQLTSIILGDRERTLGLRHRYLTIILDSLHAPGRTELPGPPPTPEELRARWVP